LNSKNNFRNREDTLVVDDHVEKVAETIVERIAVFKYFK
jgi:hypothetical protein